MGQTSRCFIVCSSPHSHVVRPSSLNPHFWIRDLHLPVPVRRRFRFDQVGQASLEPGGGDSLGLNESLCGVVWRWLDQRFSLRVRALPSRGSTEWRKLCLDFSLFLARSCSYRGLAGYPASPGIVASFRGRYDISYNVDLIIFSLCPFPDEYAHVCQIWCQLVHPFGSYSRFLIF